MSIASAVARRRWTLGIATWIIALAAGNVALFRYTATPGSAPEAPQQWPRASRLVPAADAPTLVLFAHPQCACTRATLAELARLMTRVGPTMRTYVVFARPDGVADDWQRTDLWERAATIPGVTVIADTVDGESKLFGAKTSGTAILFDAGGVARFAGGITAARGHEGASIGFERIVALVTTGVADRSTSDVFGCALASANAVRP